MTKTEIQAIQPSEYEFAIKKPIFLWRVFDVWDSHRDRGFSLPVWRMGSASVLPGWWALDTVRVLCYGGGFWQGGENPALSLLAVDVIRLYIIKGCSGTNLLFAHF